MWYFIIFGKTILIILSPHSINSDIHFVQGLLSLGCQKNIKAGSTRGKYFQMAVIAAWPRPHSYCLSEQAGWELIDLQSGVLRPPLKQARSKNMGEVETKAISTGTPVAMLWCGHIGDSYHLNS